MATFTIYGNSDAGGGGTFTVALSGDGIPFLMIDIKGFVWVFYIDDDKLLYKVSTDATGTAYGSPVTLEASAIPDGQPSAIQHIDGKITVIYYKAVATVDTLYQAVSTDFGATWTKGAVAT